MAGMRWLARVAVVAGLIVTVAGCGGGEGAESGSPSTGAAPADSAPTTPATPPPAADPTEPAPSPTDPPPTATGSAPSSAPGSTATPAPACTLGGLVASVPLRRRLAQLLFVTVEPTDVGQAEALAADEGIGGVFVPRSSGLDGVLQSGRLNDLAGAGAVPPFVAVDDEGGRVQAADELAGSLPSARDLVAARSPAEVQALARDRGEILRQAGITMDFAPVVDVSSQSDGQVIGDRSFGADPETVVAYAGAYADGLRQAGVVPVLKHFPGHGRAEGDSHLGVAVAPPLDELADVDLVPYQELAGPDTVVMVGHLQVPGLTEEGLPTSLSPATIDGLLRDDLGFDGLVVTDDLAGMRAVTNRFGIAEATRRALSAGADLALGVTPPDVAPVLDRLEEAVAGGQLSEDQVNRSVERVWQAKGYDPCR